MIALRLGLFRPCDTLNPEEHSIRTAPAILAASLATAAAAQTPGFWLVGMPAGSQSGGVSGLSQDGTVAVGSNFNPGADRVVGFRWSVAQGRHDFGNEPGMPDWTAVSGCSSDGSVVVGKMYEAFVHPSSAYRLVGNGLPQSLGTGGASEAFGVSGDGSTVVGWTHGNNGLGQAFRWTAGGGLQGLGFLRPNGTRSQAEAISRDGSTIVGYGQAGPFNTYEAFRWTESGGMEHLPPLPGALYPDTYAHAVSANGLVVVGAGSEADPEPNSRAVRWTASGVESLGTLPGYRGGGAHAVSDDGSHVGGTLYNGVEPTIAFIWTSQSGMMAATDYLLGHGIVVPSSFRPENVRAISGDGLTFAGYGLNLTTNLREGFVATIPAPSTVVLVSLPALALAKRRRGG